ncbi:uncharacterized protein At2g34160-like isoform X1 [Mangifera indica]|uniref:uncharacterized protein At2g34160-like isoform X1 n=1 Tax=Mangifera indica TaxID=29780 RepID=UPI001CFA3504|nr:uncharacterized protein At2g34160-like isoform X1 [Mangifera indica]
MEEVTEGVNNINLSTDSIKRNRIQVSNTKKPLFFYVNLAKRYMQQHNEVELSALGMAIATVVTVAEILKNNGLAVEKSMIICFPILYIFLVQLSNLDFCTYWHELFAEIMTSTVDMRDESRVRSVQKAKIEIVLEKTANFDELMAAAADEAEARDAEEQS